MREKEACVLLLSLTLVSMCPCTIPKYPRDRPLSSIYLIRNAHTQSNQTSDNGPKYTLQSKL